MSEFNVGRIGEDSRNARPGKRTPAIVTGPASALSDWSAWLLQPADGMD